MTGNEGLIGRVLARVTYIGLVMNVMLPATILVAGVLFFDRELSTTGGLHLQGRPNVQLYFYICIVLTVLVFAAAYFIRDRMLGFALHRRLSDPEDRFSKSAIRMGLIVFSCNAALAVFGIILMTLGAAIEVMMLFAALSMIGYQMLRPRRGYLEKLLAHVSPEIVSDDDDS